MWTRMTLAKNGIGRLLIFDQLLIPAAHEVATVRQKCLRRKVEQ